LTKINKNINQYVFDLLDRPAHPFFVGTDTGSLFGVDSFDWHGVCDGRLSHELDTGFWRSLQQPLLRRLEIRKCLDIYTSITSCHQEKPPWVHSLWRLNKYDFYSVARENPRFFRRQVFFYNRDIPLGSRNVDEKFIAIRALAMLGN
jgi:hypothetical protein